MTRVAPDGESRRAGKTLIELAIVVGLVGTVLTFVGQTMVGLFRVEGRSRSTVVSGLAIDRLAEQFRDDVRTSKSVEVVPAAAGQPTRCVMTPVRGVPRRIVYVADGATVTRRIEARGDTKHVGDSFRLGRVRTNFTIDEEEFVVLGIAGETDDQPDATPRFTTRIEVRLPRNERPDSAREPTP